MDTRFFLLRRKTQLPSTICFLYRWGSARPMAVTFRLVAAVFGVEGGKILAGPWGNGGRNLFVCFLFVVVVVVE